MLIAKNQIILDGRTLFADVGERVLDVCDESPVQVMETQCRGGHCGRCLVRVLRGAVGLSPASARELDTLRALAAPADGRLGCQVVVVGQGLTIELQTSSAGADTRPE